MKKLIERIAALLLDLWVRIVGTPIRSDDNESETIQFAAMHDFIEFEKRE